MKKKLRVGLLLDGYRAPAWVHLMLTRVIQGEQADIVLVVLNGTAAEPPDFFHKLRTRWRLIPSRLVTRVLTHVKLRLMERVHCQPDAFELMDLRPLLQGTPGITVEPIRKTYSDYFLDTDIARIRSFELDVLVRLGFRVLRGEILSASKYGVWSYHHGDYQVNRGGPAGFWETMESWPETGAVLQILTEDLDGGMILYKSWSLTNVRSVTLNNNARYWTAASFLPRVLNRLGTIGETAFLAEVAKANLHPTFYSGRLYSKPGNAQMAVLLLGKLVEKLQHRIRHRFYRDQWCLLFCKDEQIATSLRRFKCIRPPRDRFWADPNVIYSSGRYSIFIEEFLHARDKGHIALITMDEEGSYDPPVTVIEEEHHLSYPFPFFVGDSLYLVAEAYDIRAVPLYRCVEFPTKWVFEKNLLDDVAAVDPTLLFHDGKWFLFVCVAENPGSAPYDELFLYFADNPVSGPWIPHPLNPIVSDVKSARPAGRIFERNGALFRPCQNCSHHYGYGIGLNQITELSETAYRENKVATIEPKWSKAICAIHTLSHAHRLTVVDANARRARYWKTR